jgi:hypothetical protein
MTATIDISEELSIVVDGKALYFSPRDLQEEFFRFPWGDFANSRDFGWWSL